MANSFAFATLLIKEIKRKYCVSFKLENYGYALVKKTFWNEVHKKIFNENQGNKNVT